MSKKTLKYLHSQMALTKGTFKEKDGRIEEKQAVAVFS